MFSMVYWNQTTCKPVHLFVSLSVYKILMILCSNSSFLLLLADTMIMYCNFAKCSFQPSTPVVPGFSFFEFRNVFTKLPVSVKELGDGGGEVECSDRL